MLILKIKHFIAWKKRQATVSPILVAYIGKFQLCYRLHSILKLGSVSWIGRNTTADLPLEIPYLEGQQVVP